ncbi:NAD-dependent epimerase/dehydratase family protein [Pseudanabaena sp. UWO310]|uniref:NAD-dependent epimerase/dehydratase family protein n=1 Tax=Pseudanabaena sp. UWO310 TaxID=2480795 RepID=UPI001158962E|nr:NAD(P)-dependent oxidoreductase [Pseudanabaena sp. UWO310]TYQ27505.1 NAD(P)-dependent oxidoreductase [Pseudanabaena sp. UWO310]
MSKKVFITGASGCVGHYLIEMLLEKTDYDLYLLVRDRRKLQIDVSDRPNVHIIEDSMQNIGNYKALLRTMEFVVSTAAGWGGEEAFVVNRDKTIELFSSLDPQVCERAIYFSTASILDSHNQIIPEAGELGTNYIASKHACLETLENSVIRDRLITVFPTLVFGGAENKPYSHLSKGLKDILKYVPYARFLKTDGSFHFVHAIDIAQIVTYLLTAPSVPLAPARLVLGMQRLTAQDLIVQFCEYLNLKVGWQFELTPFLVDAVIKLFRIEVAEWDRFCIAQRHFTYDVVSPETFGMVSQYPRLANLLAEVK